jgi:cell division protein ZipA
MSLRVILLIIGVGVIAGIYLWDLWSRKQALKKRHSEVVFGHELKTGLAATDDDDDNGKASTYAQLSAVQKGQDDLDIYDLSLSAKHRDEPHGQDQFPLILHDAVEPDDAPAVSRGSGEHDVESGEVTEDELLMLVITPDRTDHFAGLDILSAVRGAGMKYGKMNVFHSYGVGDMNLDEPLFSLANLYEPGEFNLEEMDSFSTRGLVIYMTLPVPIEPEIALEIMINTAQRIAEVLGGVLCDPTRRQLTDDELDKMRAKMKRFQPA